MSSKRKYCWDSNVFIAWLASEADKPLADIGAVVDEVDKGEASMLVPATVVAEIFEIEGNAAGLDAFRQFLHRSNVVFVETTMDIANRAAEIRRLLRAAGRHLIRTPDATVAATAVSLRADVLHTFDNHLLALNRDPIVEGLPIERPRPLGGQMGLF